MLNYFQKFAGTSHQKCPVHSGITEIASQIICKEIKEIASQIIYKLSVIR